MQTRIERTHKLPDVTTTNVITLSVLTETLQISSVFSFATPKMAMALFLLLLLAAGAASSPSIETSNGVMYLKGIFHLRF